MRWTHNDDRRGARRASLPGWMVVICALVFGSAMVSAQLLDPPGGNTGGKTGSVWDIEPDAAPILIEFEIDELDLGDIPDTSKITKSVKFTNISDQMVHIDSVNGGCNCTVAELKKRDYLPGESGEIEITFDPEDRTGVTKKTVQMVAHKRVYKFDVRANIKPVVQTIPRIVSLREVVWQQGATAEMRLRSEREHFEIEDIQVDLYPLLVAELQGIEETEKPDGTVVKDAVIKLTMDPAVPMGVFSSRMAFAIKITSDDGEEIVDHKVMANLSANIVGDIQALPGQLQMRAVTAGQTVSRDITVRSRTGKPFTVTGTEWMPDESPGILKVFPDIEVKPVEAPDGTPMYRLSVDVQFPEELGMVRGTLLVKTDNEDHPQLPITMFGVIRAKRAAQATPRPEAKVIGGLSNPAGDSGGSSSR